MSLLQYLVDGIVAIPQFFINCVDFITSMISIIPQPFLSLITSFVSVIFVVLAVKVVHMND